MSIQQVQDNSLIVYVDMDDTLCNFKEVYAKEKSMLPHVPYPQSIPGFYRNLEALPEAVATMHWLAEQAHFDVYILSAPSVKNPLCYTEKRLWVEEHLGMNFAYRLILTSHKHLNVGDYLIDDNVSGKGQDFFTGEVLQFGSSTYPDWRSVRAFFENLLARQGNT